MYGAGDFQQQPNKLKVGNFLNVACFLFGLELAFKVLRFCKL